MNLSHPWLMWHISWVLKWFQVRGTLNASYPLCSTIVLFIDNWADWFCWCSDLVINACVDITEEQLWVSHPCCSRYHILMSSLFRYSLWYITCTSHNSIYLCNTWTFLNSIPTHTSIPNYHNNIYTIQHLSPSITFLCIASHHLWTIKPGPPTPQ